MPDRKTNITSLRLSPAIHRRLEQISAENDVKKTVLIRRAILEYLSKLPR